MMLNIIIFFGLLIYLLFLNLNQIRFNFCLDKSSSTEKHKLLLELNNKTPISGSFFFLPLILYLSYQINLFFSFFCILFFFLGLLSDLKITHSPKLRLFLQFFLVIIFLIFNNEIVIDTRIEFLNDLMNNQTLRVLISSFFIVVLINGFNFIDGVNNLCSLNIFLISIFLYFTVIDLSILNMETSIKFLIISLLIFVVFNFFGKNFLGDGGVYGLSFFLAILVIKLSILNEKISPYFIANLLWYPAFENLFSIFRRTFYKKKNYEADNEHLHQLLFKYFQNKKIIKKKYLLSSFVGILINCYFFVFYFLGYRDYSDTKLQLVLILLSTISYLSIYFLLKKSRC
tara:strand:+ start:95 stop:1123 length:1029 start_codon:yes stop_codon:yes gene_type:complete